VSSVKPDANLTPCAECGRESPPGSRYCFCGKDLVVPAPAPPKGVGGWLLWFCFQAILLGPAVVGFRILQNLRTLQVREGGLTQASVLVATDAGARVAILILGMVAGSLLLYRRRGAVQFARGYLAAAAPCCSCLVPSSGFCISNIRSASGPPIHRGIREKK